VEAINQLFMHLLNIGLGAGAVVAAFFLMWGGYLYMSAGGSPRQMESGKSAMLNALIGFAVVLGCRTIVGMIASAIGTGA
jgi:hypothetical protein